MRHKMCSEMQYSIHRSHRGFTILEVLFAGSILLLGLSAVAGVFSTARVSFALQRDLAAATTVAEGFLEQIVILPPSSLLLEPGAATVHPARHFTRETLPTTPGSATDYFTLTWTVLSNDPIPTIKRINVHVAWDSDRPHSVELFTFRE